MRHPWFQRLVVLMLVLLMQGPALLTQEIAWVRMLVTYTAERGLVQGVTETFDGEHPCSMCAQAEKFRQQEADPRRPQQAPGESTLRWVLEWAKVMPPQRMSPRPLLGVDIGMVRVEAELLARGRDRDAPIGPPPRLG